MAKQQKNKEDKPQETSEENRVGPPYDTITIDTCIFEHKSFSFNSELLATLKDSSSIDIVISEIVVKEVSKHLREKKKNILDSILSSKKNGTRMGFLDDVTSSQLDEIHSTIDAFEASKVFDDYLEAINASIVKIKDCDIKTLTDYYFASCPPFMGAGKKNEFPDAIALLTLEAWAKKNDKKILAISDDPDWISFSEKSNYIDVISDLETVTAQIFQLREATEKIERMFLSSSLYGGEYDYIAEELNKFFNEKVTESDFRIDNSFLSSPHDFRLEAIVTKVEYEEYSLDFNESDMDVTVYNYSSKRTIFTIKGTVKLSVSAEVTHYQTAEKEEFIFGSSDGIMEGIEVPVDFLLTLKGDVNAENYEPEFLEMSLAGDIEIELDDSFLEPDYK